MASVPKFGSWDDDNDDIPYTTYFNNARKEKTTKIINPNDPEENPEAFAGSAGVIKQKNITTHRTNTAGSNSGHQGIRQNQKRQSKKYDQQSSLESGNFVLSSPGNEKRRTAGAGAGNNPYDDHSYISAASVPKFGAWDEMDPNSGDGFTVIFNRVKEEKQNAASKIPLQPSTSSITPPHTAAVNSRQSSNIKLKSKILSCCLFPKAKGM